MQKYLVLCVVLLALASADECPDGGACEEGNTCCKVPSDGYECCPLHQAECCEDHLHCCPQGTVCAVDQSLCVNATVSLPWMERVSAKPSRLSKSFRMISASSGDEDDNVCPDQSRCPAEFSCLKALKGYSCCPLAQGVPCADGKHCCSEDHHCSIDGSSCIKQKEESEVGAVMCSDGESECPDGTTCCETPEGGWGCCPMPKAVCCEDKAHCCPEGSTCDIRQSKCISSTNKEMPMWAKFPARKRAEWENQKEDSHVTALAISDNLTSGQHPETTTAITSHAFKGGETTTPSVSRAGGMDVPCDGTTACEDGTTCCKTKEGEWACCPLPEAVCCDDFIHCCPHGKKCNLAAQTCEDASGPSVAWVEKVPAVPRQRGGMDVPCDGTTACEDGTTCCKTKEGGWACCPLPEAVCCDDFIHCCPHGKKCNMAAQKCEDPSGPSVAWVEKVPAVPRQRGGMDVPCDGTTACEDGTTCCKTKEGEWACCPLPEAVCCDDFIHCCPHGKKCNLAAQTCEDPSGPSVAWVEKVPAVPRQRGGMDVPCDGTAYCRDGTTCCKNKQGNWACCPLPEAVCCADHETCCPHGTTCNQTTHNCDSASGTVPMVGKVPALTTLPSDPEAPPKDNMELPTEDDDDDDDDNMVLSTEEEEEEEDDYDDEEHSTQKGKNQCDPKTTCPKHTTCCFMRSSQKWGCCPLPEAVCCADGDHCCPKYYTCNDNKTSCLKGKVVIPWYNKLAAESVDSAPEPTSVKCDAQNRCPEGSTCCQLATGQWGCCPLPKAVCCVDQQHCCPLGFRCNVGSGTCQKLRFLQVQSVPLTKVSVPEPQPQPKPSAPQWRGIHCGGRFTCKSGETCCQLSATTWGCCPYRNAVCCSDMMHCCPTGLTCGKDGTCSQSTGFNWDYWQVFFSNKRALVL